MSFRAILARQKFSPAAHMAVTRHRFAASRATNPKAHSPLAVFAARELMTSGAFRPVRHTADIVGPAPDKGGVGAYAWRVGHITSLAIGKPGVGRRIGPLRMPY